MGRGTYAKGKWALGHCARSGRKMLLRNMIADGYYPNLIVDTEWYEPKHPQESLPSVHDPVSLFRPAPDRSRVGAVLAFGGNPGLDPVPGGGFGGGSDLGGGGTGGGVSGATLSFGYEIAAPNFAVTPPLISLVGAGAPQLYDQTVATTGADLDKPATQAGDTLFVFANLSDSLGVPSAGWTTLTGIINNNQGRIYQRIADDTAADNFSWTSGQFSNGAAVFAAWRTTPGFFLDHVASNIQLQLTNTAWAIDNFVAGADDTLVFALMSRSGNGIGGTFSVTNTVDIANEIIGSGDNHGAANHALWRFWGWEFEPSSRAHPVDDQTYAPNQNAAIKTRYARFALAAIP